MPYRLVVPASVRKQFRDALARDAPHFQTLGARLVSVRTNPRGGHPMRRELVNHYYVELGGYWLFYFVDESKQEVRFYWLERVMLGW